MGSCGLFVWQGKHFFSIGCSRQNRPRFERGTSGTCLLRLFLLDFEGLCHVAYAHNNCSAASVRLSSVFNPREFPQDLQYGVVDMYLLGECDDIILSPESTFGGVAAGRLGKPSWRVTKNPENWLDDSWESKRMVAKTAGTSPCSFGWQFVPQTSCYNKLHFVPEQLNQENDLCRTV